MDVYNQNSLPSSFQTVRAIKKLFLLADGYNMKATCFAKGKTVMKVSLSTLHETAESTTTVFDEMHGADRTLVFDDRLDIPEQAAVTSVPRPLNIVIPLPVPWFYQLTPNRGRKSPPTTLVIDYQIFTKQSDDDYVLEMAGYCKSAYKSFGKNGVGYVGSRNRLPLVLTTGNRAYATGALSFNFANALKKAPVKLLLRAGPFSNWPALPLPGGCNVLVPPVVIDSKIANDTGAGKFYWALPRTQDIVGIQLHAQAVATDINANSAELETSLGVSTAICGPYGVSRLVQLNGKNAATNPIALSNNYGFAHVIAFQ